MDERSPLEPEKHKNAGVISWNVRLRFDRSREKGLLKSPVAS